MMCPNCGEPLFHFEEPAGECLPCRRVEGREMNQTFALGSIVTNTLSHIPGRTPVLMRRDAVQVR